MEEEYLGLCKGYSSNNTSTQWSDKAPTRINFQIIQHVHVATSWCIFSVAVTLATTEGTTKAITLSEIDPEGRLTNVSISESVTLSPL